jgi:hypothetical protein
MSRGTIAGADAGSKRKRMGTHVIGLAQAAVVGPVAGAPSTPLVCSVAKKPPIPKQRLKKRATKPPVVKRATKKKGSLAAINAAAAATLVAGGEHAREVFDEMPERCVSIFLSGKEMAISKGKMFTLQHCYKLLEHSNKWKIRDQEAPPVRGTLVKSREHLVSRRTRRGRMVSRRRKISSRSKQSRQALETRWTI